MEYLFCKAMHMVGFVSWFAGLFYIPRLFIYHVEGNARPEPERGILHAQYMMMERRLWRAITVPAMVITFLFGARLAMIYVQPFPTFPTWLAVKLGLVGLLVVYHVTCGRIRKQLAAGTCQWTSAGLRQLNEVATLLLVAIVMLAVFKTLFSALWGTLALVGLGIVLAVAVRLMKNRWAPATGAREAGQERA